MSGADKRGPPWPWDKGRCIVRQATSAREMVLFRACGTKGPRRGTPADTWRGRLPWRRDTCYKAVAGAAGLDIQADRGHEPAKGGCPVRNRIRGGNPMRVPVMVLAV